jgi:hypothetical protein
LAGKVALISVVARFGGIDILFKLRDGRPIDTVDR